MPGVHARLSASSAARWINCPPSALLAEQFTDTQSPYAAAGTLAHAIAELKARKHFLEPMGPRKYAAAMKKLKGDPAYEPGMDAATEAYLDHLKAIALNFPEKPFVALEVRVDYSDYAPRGFGTADCIMIYGDTIHIVDYKNGSGVPVDALENPQLQLYALGALKVYAPFYGDKLTEIHVHIVQPNAGGVRSWYLDRNALIEWGEKVVRPAAELAYDGKGDFCPGPWCDDHFCPARATCAARAKKMLGYTAYTSKDPALLDNDEIAGILEIAGNLHKWLTAVQDYAFNEALAGRKISGFKLVEGRRSREWLDQDKAFEALRDRGVAEALLWERKPVTVAGLEKLLGKAGFAAASDGLVLQKPGKPALVPESDRRPEWTPANAAFEVVD